MPTTAPEARCFGLYAWLVACPNFSATKLARPLYALSSAFRLWWPRKASAFLPTQKMLLEQRGQTVKPGSWARLRALDADEQFPCHPFHSPGVPVVLVAASCRAPRWLERCLSSSSRASEVCRANFASPDFLLLRNGRFNSSGEIILQLQHQTTGTSVLMELSQETGCFLQPRALSARDENLLCTRTLAELRWDL